MADKQETNGALRLQPSWPELDGAAVSTVSTQEKSKTSNNVAPASKRRPNTDSESSGSDSGSESEPERSARGRIMSSGVTREQRLARKLSESFELANERRNSKLKRVGQSKLSLIGEETTAGLTAVQKAVVAKTMALNERLPGGTWKLIVHDRLMSASTLRGRLLELFTLLGVVTALVSAIAVDGITNSASSFSDFEDRAKNQTICFLGGACVNTKRLYKVYGLLVSMACLFSLLALVLSIMVYNYLLIQPMSKTRLFVKRNVELFPSIYALVILAVMFIVSGVCVQCLAAFGQAIGYTVLGTALLFTVLAFYLLYRFEKHTRQGLASYNEKIKAKRRQSEIEATAQVVENPEPDVN